MRWNLRQSSALLTGLIAGALLSAFTYNHQAGTGGDSDPRTYHFIPTNENRQLAAADNTPIKNEDILTYYGQSNGFDITLDGQSITTYNWNFAPDAAGIGDSRWADSAYPALDQFRIDTTRGRIKSNPALNWKYAISAGSNVGIDATKSTLVKFDRYRNGTVETIVGVAIYYKTDGIQYFRTLEMPFDTGGTQKENTDSYDGSTGWTLSAEAALTPAPGSACSELESDSDDTAANTNTGFIAYCGDQIYVWVYAGGTFSVNAQQVTGFNGIGGSTKITKHVDVGVNGTVSTEFVYTNLHPTSNKLEIKRGTAPATTSSFSYKSDQSSINSCYTVSGTLYYYGDAYDASIDCSGGTCQTAYVMEFAPVDSPPTCATPSLLKTRIFATTAAICLANNASECTVPIDDSDNNVKKNPEVVALQASRAFLTFKSASETTGIYLLKGAVYDYDSTAAANVWPMEGSFNAGTPKGRKIAQISEPSEDVPVIKAVPGRGQGDDVYIFWTQGGPASKFSSLSAKLAEPARYVYFRRWRWGNYNSTTNELRLDSVYKTQSSTSSLSSFDWISTKNGVAHFSFIQDGKIHFGISSGLSLPTSFTSFSQGGSVLSGALTYSKYPLPAAKKPANGRTILVWLEGTNIYARPYYDQINLEVAYNSKDWGTVLKPDGTKPPLVRNNYIRPGYDKDVEIFINDRSADETVTVKIYTMDGKLVRTLVDGAPYNSFRQPLKWDKRTSSGKFVASGVYHVYVETSGGFSDHHPVIIVR